MAWAVNGTPDTLSSAADVAEISDLNGLTFNQFLFHKLQSGNTQIALTFNNDTGNNYAARLSSNGGSDTTSLTGVNLDIWRIFPDEFFVIDMFSISSEEKLMIIHEVGKNADGAANVPIRAELACKWANTANTLDVITMDQTGTGDYPTDTNLSALGTD